MKRKKKKRKYLLHSEYLGFTKPIGVVWFLALVLAYAWAIKDIYLNYQEDNEIWSEGFTWGIGLLAYVILFIFFYYTTIKKLILYRFGVKHKAEIIRTKYYEGYRSEDQYYLEIEFINNKGRKKRLYTQGYHDSPNVHLKSVYCSVYEWKGFYVEGDFQLIEDIEHFEQRTPPIPMERTNDIRPGVVAAIYLSIVFLMFVVAFGFS